MVFFTDGDPNPSDREAAKRAIQEASQYPVFWQFVGMGYGFEFLKGLDTMGGRVVDNANFFDISRLAQMSDEQLFEKLLKEFPEWVPVARAKGWIA